MGDQMGQVLCVDGTAEFRLGLRALCSDCLPDLRIIELDTFAGARLFLKETVQTSLVVLDLGTADSGGFLALCEMCKEFPSVPVIVVADNADGKMAQRVRALGAACILPKRASGDLIASAIARVLADPARSCGLLPAENPSIKAIATLSPAQLRVLRGLKRGLRNKEIAFELGLAEKTIKAYMSALYRKLGVQSRTQALVFVQGLSLDLQQA